MGGENEDGDGDRSGEIFVGSRAGRVGRRGLQKRPQMDDVGIPGRIDLSCGCGCGCGCGYGYGYRVLASKKRPMRCIWTKMRPTR